MLKRISYAFVCSWVSSGLRLINGMYVLVLFFIVAGGFATFTGGACKGLVVAGGSLFSPMGCLFGYVLGG